MELFIASSAGRFCIFFFFHRKIISATYRCFDIEMSDAEKEEQTSFFPQLYFVCDVPSMYDRFLCIITFGIFNKTFFFLTFSYYGLPSNVIQCETSKGNLPSLLNSHVPKRISISIALLTQTQNYIH